jgi:GH24 family phage-related lysozyme (muramidase)
MGPGTLAFYNNVYRGVPGSLEQLYDYHMNLTKEDALAPQTVAMHAGLVSLHTQLPDGGSPEGKKAMDTVINLGGAAGWGAIWTTKKGQMDETEKRNYIPNEKQSLAQIMHPEDVLALESTPASAVGGGFDPEDSSAGDDRPLFRTTFDPVADKFVAEERVPEGYKPMTWGGAGGEGSRYLQYVRTVQEAYNVRKKRRMWEQIGPEGDLIPWSPESFIKHYVTPATPLERKRREAVFQAGSRQDRANAEIEADLPNIPKSPPVNPATTGAQDLSAGPYRGEALTGQQVYGFADQAPEAPPSIEDQAAQFRAREGAARPAIPGRGTGLMERLIAAEEQGVNGRSLIDLATENLVEDEGEVLQAYPDDVGNATIGVGHLITSRSAGIMAKLFGISKEEATAITKGEQALTQEQSRALLKRDIEVHQRKAKKLIPDLPKFPPFVQVAILNGTFRGDLSGSPKTIALINKGKWEDAAAEYLDNAEYRRRKAKGDDGVVKRTNDEHRHGMDEFNGRLAKVEAKQDSLQREVFEFKSDFHDHDVTERQDRQRIIERLDKNQQCTQQIKQTLSEMKGFKAGMKAGAALLMLFFGGVITLAIKKLLGL